MAKALNLRSLSLVFVFALTIFIGVLPAMTQDVHAADDQGYYQNIMWSYDSSTKVFHISGHGEMPDFNYNAPWYNKTYREEIETIDIGQSITSIGKSAFYGFSGATDVRIEEGITSVGSGAFFGCESLRVVYIPESVNYIGPDAFAGCDALKTVYFHPASEGKTLTFGEGDGLPFQNGQTAAYGLGSTRLFKDSKELKAKESLADLTGTYTWKELPLVTVYIDVGKGHENLFTADRLNDFRLYISAESATIEENIIKMEGVYPAYSEGSLRGTIHSYLRSFIRPGYKDNGERYMNIGFMPLEDQSSPYDLEEYEIYNSGRYDTLVSDDLKYYLLWSKPYAKLELRNEDLFCGDESSKAVPEVPDGMTMDPEKSSWMNEGNENVECFEGGKEYTFKGKIYMSPNGDLWRNYLDPDNFTLTVDGGKDVEYEIDGNWINFSFKATAEHEYGAWKRLNTTQHQRVCANDKTHVQRANHTWDKGKVTKKATQNQTGIKTYTCTVCKATRTETIPKPKAKPKASATKIGGTLLVKMTAKGDRGLTIGWTKVTGVAGYDIYSAECDSNNKRTTSKLIKTIKGNKTFSLTRAGLKKNKSYKAYVKAFIYKNGKKHYVKMSPLVHAYTGNGTANYTNAKSIVVNTTSIILKPGKTFQVKGKVNRVINSKKLMSAGHAPTLRYTTSNTKIATVNSNGKITAKGKGTCFIYLYAHNGVSKQVKVTVK